MTTPALIFMLAAWTVVIGLALWSYWRLLSTPRDEKLPPPGSIP
jgi:hypothetical protein